MNSEDEISEAERRKIMESDRLARRASTYHALADAAANELSGGRYAQSANRQTVIGSSPISYPAQPENSPWAKDPMPQEPPLGWSVEDMEPTGEPFELERSRETSSAMAASQVDDAGPGSKEVGSRPSTFKRGI